MTWMCMSIRSYLYNSACDKNWKSRYTCQASKKQTYMKASAKQTYIQNRHACTIRTKQIYMYNTLTAGVFTLNK